MKKLAIFGAAGRMGRSMIENLGDFPELALVAAVEAPGHPAVGSPVGPAAPGLAITDDAEAAVAACDVAVDFTFHEAVPAHAALCAAHTRALLVGTTALSPAERAAVLAAGEKAPVMIAANMSVGVNVLLSLVRRAAQALDAAYDVEITEMHHRHKKDAPSGTALALARAVADGRGGPSQAGSTRFGREGLTGERPVGEIAVHALRGGDVVGDPDVLFAADGEILRLSHRATSRACLSRGALRAAAWLERQKPGVHEIADSLGL